MLFEGISTVSGDSTGCNDLGHLPKQQPKSTREAELKHVLVTKVRPRPWRIVPEWKVDP